MFAFATRVVSGVLCSLEGTGNESVPYSGAALFQFFAQPRWDLPRESHQNVRFRSRITSAVLQKRLQRDELRTVLPFWRDMGSSRRAQPRHKEFSFDFS